MPLYVKGTKTEVVGTLEELRGVAYAFSLEVDGSPEYEGETKMWWDEQRTVMRDGERVWVEDDGTEHLQSQIEYRKENDDETESA